MSLFDPVDHAPNGKRKKRHSGPTPVNLFETEASNPQTNTDLGVGTADLGPIAPKRPENLRTPAVERPDVDLPRLLYNHPTSHDAEPTSNPATRQQSAPPVSPEPTFSLYDPAILRAMYNHPTSQDTGTEAQAFSSGSVQEHLPELSEPQPLMRLYDPEFLRSFYNHPTSQDLPETSPESPSPEIQLALATGSNQSETSALFDAVPQAQTPVYTPEQAAPTDPLFGSNDANPTLDPTPSEPAQFTQSTEQVAQSPSVSVDLRPAIGISEATQTSELSNFPQFVSRAGERGVTLPNNEGEYLAFDGSMLMHVKNGEVIRAWPGVSGKDGFQSREHETERNIGPLPEGTWMLSQDQYQEYQPFKLIEPFGGDTWFDQNIGTGRFPRGTNAWGRSRVQILTPEGGRVDERTGRDNFSIHGGTEPGSAGCIDLTIYMDDFSEVFTKNGKDLPLIVAYPD